MLELVEPVPIDSIAPRSGSAPVAPPPQAAALPRSAPAGPSARRLILIGSYMEHVTQTDPDRKARLMKGLHGFLERDRDRELFDLAPKEVSK